MGMKGKSVVVVCLFICSLTLGAAWTTKKITNNTGYVEYKLPDIALNGLNAYVVFSGFLDGYPWGYNISFQKSLDGGATWKAAKGITSKEVTEQDELYRPEIAVSGSFVYVVWADNMGNDEIYFRKSADSGGYWQATKMLTNNPGRSTNPSIAVSGSNVYVVWYDRTPGNAEIYLRKSSDGGTTWQTAQRLTNNAGDSYDPGIAVSGSNVYVVWYDYSTGNSEIYFRKSADGGTTWQSAKRLSSNAGESTYPRIAASGSSVFVVWSDMTSGDNEIYFRKSADSGVTWQTCKWITNNAGSSEVPEIAISGSNVYMVWMDNTPGNYEIYFKKSADGGTTWQTAQRLTNNAGKSTSPRVAVNASNVYVVWSDTIANITSIYLAYSPL